MLKVEKLKLSVAVAVANATATDAAAYGKSIKSICSSFLSYLVYFVKEKYHFIP